MVAGTEAEPEDLGGVTALLRVKQPQLDVAMGRVKKNVQDW